MSTIKELVEDFNKQKAILTERLKNEFKTLIAESFNEIPEVDGIIWNQYTPYFNDGEPCEFSVGDMYPIYTKETFFKFKKAQEPDISDEKLEEAYEEYAELCSAYDYEEAHYDLNEPEDIAEKFYKIIGEFRAIPDFIYLDLFGDHVTVKAFRDKVVTEEYDHD